MAAIVGHELFGCSSGKNNKQKAKLNIAMT